MLLETKGLYGRNQDTQGQKDLSAGFVPNCSDMRLPSPLILTQHGKQTGACGHLSLLCLGFLTHSPGQGPGEAPGHKQSEIGPKHMSVHRDYVVFHLQQSTAVWWVSQACVKRSAVQPLWESPVLSVGGVTWTLTWYSELIQPTQLAFPWWWVVSEHHTTAR